MSVSLLAVTPLPPGGTSKCPPMSSTFKVTDFFLAGGLAGFGNKWRHFVSSSTTNSRKLVNETPCIRILSYNGLITFPKTPSPMRPTSFIHDTWIPFALSSIARDGGSCGNTTIALESYVVFLHDSIDPEFLKKSQ